MTPGDEQPEGWLRGQLKDTAHLIKDKVDPASVSPETPYIGLEHVEAHTMRLLGQGQAADVRSIKSVFQPGDVLYGKLRPYLNKVVRPDFNGICSTDFLVFGESSKLDPRIPGSLPESAMGGGPGKPSIQWRRATARQLGIALTAADLLSSR